MAAWRAIVSAKVVFAVIVSRPTEEGAANSSCKSVVGCNPSMPAGTPLTA